MITDLLSACGLILVRVVAAAALVFVSARASATPVSYSESVSGDLPFLLPLTPPLDFDLGLNTVSGNMHLRPGSGDTDSFAFSIPTGAQLTNINLSLVTTVDSGTQLANTRWAVVVGNAFSFPPIVEQQFDLLVGSPGSVLGGALTLPAGLWGIQSYGGTYGGSLEGGVSTDYTWTFTVEPAPSAVPEPASLMLLTSGLFGAIVRRVRVRRRRHVASQTLSAPPTRS